MFLLIVELPGNCVCMGSDPSVLGPMMTSPPSQSPRTVFTPAPVREAVVCVLCFLFEPAKMSSASREEEADAASSLPSSTDEPSQALAASDSLDSPPRPLERSVGQLPSPPLLPTPPPKAGSRTTRSVTGGSMSIHLCLPPVVTGLPLWAGSHRLLLWVGLWAGSGEQS